MFKFKELISTVSINDATLPIIMKVDNRLVSMRISKKQLKTVQEDIHPFETWDEVLAFFFNL